MGMRSLAMGSEPDAEVGLHVAATLAHAMDFGLLDMEIIDESGGSEDGGDGEDALSTHAGKYYI